MPRRPNQSLPLPKHWTRRVRSVAVHAIALARLALTTAHGQAGEASYPAGTTFAGAGLPPAGTMNLCMAHVDQHTLPFTLSGAIPGTTTAISEGCNQNRPPFVYPASVHQNRWRFE